MTKLTIMVWITGALLLGAIMACPLLDECPRTNDSCRNLPPTPTEFQFK